MAELGEGLSGYLDVQDATLRAPRIEAVSNIGISNTAPQHAFSVGSNLYVSTDSSNVLTVDGNVVCEGVKVGLIEIIPSYDFAAVSNVGNVTQSTIQFSNATTAFVTTANIEVGTANLFVDTVTGRVGIGKTDPGAALDVVGDVEISSNLAVNTDTLFVDSVGGTVGIGSTLIDITDNTLSGAGNGLYIHNPVEGGHLLTLGTQRPWVFEQGLSDASTELNLRSLNSGKHFNIQSQDYSNVMTVIATNGGGTVGIGTTNPLEKLDVRGTIITPVVSYSIDQDAPYLIAGTGGYTGASTNWNTYGIQHRIKSDSGGSPRITVDTPNGEVFTIVNGGNIGIGITNPGADLTIVSNASQVVDMESLNNKFGFRFATPTATNNGNRTFRSGIYFDNDDGYGAHNINFCITGGTGLGNKNLTIASTDAAMTIQRGSRNVGIGTTNPDTKLEVKFPSNDGSQPILSLIRDGTMSSTVGATFRAIDIKTQQTGYSPVTHASINLVNYNPDGSAQFGLSQPDRQDTGLGFSVIHDGNTVENALVIRSNGRVGINDTTPSYQLDVNGTIRATNVSPSDDRIKYNEQNVSNALTLISQLNPQKYEKIMERPNPYEGTWIPTDEEWENVKGDYKHGDEFGFIAQDVRGIPELAFLVNGEEMRSDTKTLTPEEYSNLVSEEQSTYTTSYIYESNVITQVEYSNLTPEEQETYTTQYTKQIETQTPLALNYQGLFVVAIGAIQELKAKNDTLEARITALESA